MKVKDMRGYSAEELRDMLSEFKAELFNLRFQHATNQLDNPMRIAEVKKSIARVQTILREKELAI